MTTNRSDRVLLTGLSGFIATHVAKRLLEEGYRVRGTVRDAAKGERTRRALAAAGVDASSLEVVEADLTRDEGWDDLARDCRFVQHTASPFPAAQPRDKFALVPAARDGALRVIEAAKSAGVERVVMTSSVVSIYHGHEGRLGARFTEADVSNVESPTISPYAVSKTLAEQAAWSTVVGSPLELAVVNPSLVLGPLLGGQAGTSVGLVAMMMRGLLPIVPRARFGVVDVRDVAEGHLRAMTVPQAAGRRFILTSEPMTLMEMGQAIGRAYPRLRWRLPHATIPNGAIRMAARLSRSAAMLVNELDAERSLDNAAARANLALTFRPAEEAVAESARSLVRHGLVQGPAGDRR